jgi:hypothetical protein
MKNSWHLQYNNNKYVAARVEKALGSHSRSRCPPIFYRKRQHIQSENLKYSLLFFLSAHVLSLLKQIKGPRNFFKLGFVIQTIYISRAAVTLFI